jgi:hypothetical protein
VGGLEGWLFLDSPSLQVLVPRQIAGVFYGVNMKWNVKENHMAVIAVHNCRKSHSEIFELSEPFQISQMFVCRTIKQYKEL